MTKDIVTNESKELAIHAAVRLLGKEYRRRFTDAVQLLDGYVCPATGETSKSNGKSYMAYTQQLNKRFGLTKEQAEAHANGECIRDLVGSIVLHSITLAEEDATSEIKAGIRERLPRETIKVRMREAFERHAQNLKRIQSNYGG